ncbi:MAG: tail-specific protease [Planctomycetota bacterium]|nr:MAG: tail-specific protease [Planctomycetota bacterium]
MSRLPSHVWACCVHRPRLVIAATLALMLGGSVWLAGQVREVAHAAPQPTDRQIALVVSQLMQDGHLAREKQELDDTISERCMTQFIKALDPMKLFFEQSDIDRFMEYKDSLDDMVKKGDIKVAYMIHDQFLKRVDERVALVDKLLPLPVDFTLDEEVIVDGDAAVYAKTPEEIYERWRKMLKYELLVIKADEKEKFDLAKAKERLGRRHHTRAKYRHQTNSDDLLELYLSSLTSGYDPHTSYMSPTSVENFNIEMKKKLQGIGAQLQSDEGYTVVNRVVPGGPADRDGRLKEKDRIVGVGEGTDGEIIDIVDMRLTDVVKHIRGDKDTVVRLQVQPGGDGERQVYAITRAEIDLKDQIARGEIVEDGKKADGSPYRVGVIDLPSFYMDMEGARKRLPDYRSTTRDCRKILDDFREKKVDAVVLDLRRNGGGSLIEAINLTGLFIDQGPVVQVKDSRGTVNHYDDPEPGMAWSGPLVVLTSKFSASASEIFAGAIQDYKRGLIVGDKTTHGKGTVQSLLDLGEELFRAAGPGVPNLGALKITIQQFYRPSGDSTQKRGVVADVELPSLTTHLDVGEGDLDYAIDFDKVDALRLAQLDLVGDAMLAQLRSRSQERCVKNDDFAKLQKRINRYLEQKQRKTVTLNEEKFLAERAEVNADKELEKAIEDENDPARPVVKRDYYFNEALAVTLDYVGMVGSRTANN